MTRGVPTDGGFVLLDALLAAALVGLAGSSVVAVATGMLDRQQRDLDRSVALVASRGLIQEYILVGTTAESDELYRYEIVLGGPVPGTSALRQAEVVAEPTKGSPSVRVAFLAPVRTP